MTIRSKIFEHAHASLLKLLSEFAVEFSVTPVNLDAFADSTALPPGDLVAISGLSMVENEPTEVISFSFAVITENDANNMTLVKRISTVFDRLRADKSFGLYHCDTGEVVGSVELMGPGQVFPVSRVSETRAMQMLNTQGALIYKQAS